MLALYTHPIIDEAHTPISSKCTHLNQEKNQLSTMCLHKVLITINSCINHTQFKYLNEYTHQIPIQSSVFHHNVHSIWYKKQQ